LKIQPLQVKWVAATSQNRMDLVKNKQADMECGSTTATFSRMEQVDFSSPVFLDTTGLLVRKASGAASFTALAGKRIAVVGGTSNEKALRTALQKASISANVIVVSTRDDGVNALQAGSVDAFASDKILLIGIAPKVKDPTQYAMLQEDLGFELMRSCCRAAMLPSASQVNRALGQIYNSEAIVEIFRGTFGSDFSPSPALLVMYGLGTYPTDGLLSERRQDRRIAAQADVFLPQRHGSLDVRLGGHDVERVLADRVDDETRDRIGLKTLFQEAAHELQPREHFPGRHELGRAL
jgi:hypothetical protein